MKDIILDIAVLTHNHSAFIENCLNSILSQNTRYNYKIHILDDCSSDSTQVKIKSFSNSQPNKIVFHQNNENIGPYKSAIKLAKILKAKYVCFLDGDDYWCYENKIQTQIDFLEQNQDYNGCFHDALIEQKNNSDDSHYLHRTQVGWKTYSQFNKYKADFMPWDLVQRNIIPTASLIFRNNNISTFLEKYKASELSLSWALHLEIIKKGKFRYFNEPWSVYIDHSQGISKKYDIIDFKSNNIKILESLLNDKEWIFFKSEILMTICSEIRLWLKSKSEQEKSAQEFNKLLKKYKYYQKQFLKIDIKHLKNEAFLARKNK